MQRLALNLGKAVPVAAAGGAAVHRAQQPQHAPGSPNGAAEPRLAMEEQEDFMVVGLQQQPVQRQEVSHAISQLASLGGVAADRSASTTPVPPSHAHARRRPASGPLIEEVLDSESDAGSSAGSEGSAANHLMAAAEPAAWDPYGAAAGGAVAEGERSSIELLTDTVANMLNNPSLMGAIEDALRRDPAFIQLVHQTGSPGLALPAPARALFIEEVDEVVIAADAESAGEARGGGGDPLLGLLSGIQRGVAVAVVHIGEAFCHLGNFLRGLGENLRLALEGSGGGPSADRTVKIERAIFKVACVVAVMVVTRRVVALPRMAV